MRKVLWFSAGIVSALILCLLGLAGRATAQIDNPNTYTPSVTPSGTVTPVPVGFTGFQQILDDAQNGGGQTVLFSGPIDFYESDSLEMVVLADGQSDVVVHLSAKVNVYRSGVAMVVRGIVSKMVTIAVRTSSGQVPEVVNAAAWVDGMPSPTPTAGGTLSRTDIAGTRVAASTATRQVRSDNLTATASAVGATRTTYWDGITSTADARHATQTQQADDYQSTVAAYQVTLTWVAQNYVPPQPTYAPGSGGGNSNPTAAPSGGGAPPGATALCVDGTYSYSQHRSGTCSHHQGVARWLVNLPP